jgi:hypothetical protein
MQHHRRHQPDRNQPARRGPTTPPPSTTPLPAGTKAIGQPASNTAYRSGTTGAALTQTTGTYNPAYQPESVTWKIPSNAVTRATAGTYTFGYTYNADGTPASETYPAAGGLTAETVNYTYDNLGYPIATTSASYYAVNAFYK